MDSKVEFVELAFKSFDYKKCKYVEMSRKLYQVVFPWKELFRFMRQHRPHVFPTTVFK